MTLFSALFGAGIVLMWQRAEAAGRPATGLHYRRTFWLMVFGAIHAYGIWAGDILFVYGVCSLWVFWLKRRSPKALIIVGMILLMVSPPLLLAGGLSVPSWPQKVCAEVCRSPHSGQIFLESRLRGGRVELAAPYNPYGTSSSASSGQKLASCG